MIRGLAVEYGRNGIRANKPGFAEEVVGGTLLLVITDIAYPSHHDLAWNAGDPPDSVNQDQKPDPSSGARQRNTPCIQRGIDRHQNADSISVRRRQCHLPMQASC